MPREFTHDIFPYPPAVFAEQICAKIRTAVAQIPDFREGAIAVRFVVKSEAAAAWLLGDADVTTPPRADTDLDFVFSVVPGGAKTRQAGWRDCDEEIACAGYVMLKLEGCARAMLRCAGRSSKSLPDLLVIEGSSNAPGAVCFDVERFAVDSDGNIDPNQFGRLLLRIYVGVSGATGAEDEHCALAAQAAIENFVIKSPACDALCVVGPGDVECVTDLA